MKSLSHRIQFKNFESGSRSYSRKSAGVLLLVGVLAGVTVGGGAGVIAATSTSTKTVTVCVDKEDNHMNYSKDSKCKSHQFKVVLNQKGVAGAKGDTGAAGAAGAAGAKGDTGAAGATGAKGDTGADGAAGTNGTNGATTNSQVKNICGANGTTACAVGLQGPGGGIVFMTPSTLGNTSGLFFEAAPSTWSSQSGDPTSVWCNNSTELLGVASATGTGAMDGANKSAVMLGVCTSGAANLADAHTATVNGFGSGVYWSSTEKDANNAWFQDFRTGRLPDNYLKTSNTIRVRPVRAF